MQGSEAELWEDMRRPTGPGACPGCGEQQPAGIPLYRLYGRYLCADCLLEALRRMQPEELTLLLRLPQRSAGE